MSLGQAIRQVDVFQLHAVIDIAGYEIEALKTFADRHTSLHMFRALSAADRHSTQFTTSLIRPAYKPLPSALSISTPGCGHLHTCHLEELVSTGLLI